jgi:prevent-host-death family protein
MPQSIPHRELRNNSSEVLRRVQAGETFEITNHGEVMAILIPPSRGPQHGLRIRRATHRGGFTTVASVTLDHPVQDTIDDLRGDT